MLPEEEEITISIRQLNTEFKCAVCLGILHDTHATMDCLHRFCLECISKSLRLSKKECPSCRVKCASRRSLRSDSNFETIIRKIYPNLEEYEAKEVLFQSVSLFDCSTDFIQGTHVFFFSHIFRQRGCRRSMNSITLASLETALKRGSSASRCRRRTAALFEFMPFFLLLFFLAHSLFFCCSKRDLGLTETCLSHQPPRNRGITTMNLLLLLLLRRRPEARVPSTTTPRPTSPGLLRPLSAYPQRGLFGIKTLRRLSSCWWPIPARSPWPN